MRITAGDLRGRVLNVPDEPGLRPTPAKVRQALFNILGPIDEMRLLDLYSGSGVMALEAISRGASALSIEQNRRLTRDMEQIRQQWHLADSWQIKTGTVERGLQALAGEHFDLIFADPPYRQSLAEKLPQWLDEQAIRCDLLVTEESTHVNPNWPEGWLCEQSRRYGDSTLHFLYRAS